MPPARVFVPNHDAMIVAIVVITIVLPVVITIIGPAYNHLLVTRRRHDHDRRRATVDHRRVIRRVVHSLWRAGHHDLGWLHPEERWGRRQERQPEGKSKRDACVSRAGYGQPDSCDCESEKSFIFHTKIRRGPARSLRFHSLFSRCYG